MRPRTVNELHKYVGCTVKIKFYDGTIREGKLGFTKEFSAEYGYRKPNYFTINNLDFKVSHIVDMELIKRGYNKRKMNDGM